MSRRYSIMATAVAAMLSLASCYDSEIGEAADGYAPTRAAKEVTNPGGLTQQADGTWMSNGCRVPIVGQGRVVNEINSSTVSVIGVSQDGLGNIVDTDLTNQCTIPATINANVDDTPIVSVKDLYHTYAAGQKVGFVYKDTDKDGATLLTLDVLKGLTLTTYLRGTKQESVYSADETSTLKLDLLSFNTGSTVSDRVLQFDATKPFDEVRMSITGVSVDAASTFAFAIKYAFVGENPEIRATSEEAFEDYWTGGTPTVNTGLGNYGGITTLTLTNVTGYNNIVDDDITNSTPFSSELAITSRATINLKRVIPTGTEIGFHYSQLDILGLSVLGENAPTLRTFDTNSKIVEESTPDKSLLGASVIGGGTSVITMMTTKECSQIQFQHPAKLLNAGGISVYYAYVREGVKLDPANYFTFGNDTTYNSTYTLPTAEEGTVEYIILSQPYGSDATIDGGKLTGMTKDGAYRIQAFYTAADGRQLSHTATIYHKSATATSGCNNFITAATHGAYATEALGGSACLLCLFNGTNDLNNVVDGDDSNYATVNQLASVLEWTPLAAFKLNKAVAPSSTIRTGFVVQASSNLLNLSALSLFKIRLYNGSTLVGEQTSTGSGTVKLSLLSFDQSRMRLSVETSERFDRIELWSKGAADVLASMRIYSLFYEPTTCAESAEGGGCMELLTNLKHNLQIDYDNTTVATGLISAGSSFSDLDLMLDGSAETGAKLSSIVAASGTKVALKFNTQKGKQSVGIIIGGLANLADVNFASGDVLKVYDDANEVASKANVSVLGADVLTEGGRTYIEVTPTADFNRIEFTTAGVDLLKTTKICGAYIRPDTDQDGIPDCADTDSGGETLTIENETFHACYGSALNISATQSGDISEVSVYCYNQDTGKNVSTTGTVANNVLTIAAKALPVGRYLLYIYSADGERLLAYDVAATIHPQTTTWKTNASSTDWNTWRNWSDGSPWKCTNVVLPSNAQRYPELSSAANNYCKNIHFEVGAELVGQTHLTLFEMAFVDMAIQGGKDYLLSAPLQSTFTGDMFVSPNAKWGKANYFTPLTADNYKESRNQPIVYQYFWSGAATEYDDSFNSTDKGGDEWSTDFNAVNTKYAIGQGFKLRAGNASDRNSYTFRFPKTHTTYHYYRSDGTATSHSHSIDRGAAAGKLMVTSLPCTVTLSRKVAGKTFLLGNPTMAHIDVEALKNGNNGISAVATTKTLIAPMEAVFIEAASDATTLEVGV